jgi:uncharacterized protein with NAD-binding domain and iron-sulfur cluster
MQRKVAILGGGCGSMATAWALTGLPNWQEKFDITVYQLGWRLGGKCASGRDADMAYRIQEHGLHVWGGFYENSFRLIQDVYGALPPDTGNPLEAWDDALKKLSTVTLQEHIDGQWINWYLDFPENSAVPGTGGVIPSIWDYVQLILNWLDSQFAKVTHPPAATPLTDQIVGESAAPTHPQHVSFLHRIIPAMAHLTEAGANPLLNDVHPIDLIRAAAALHKSLDHDVQSHFDIHRLDIATLVDQAVENVVQQVDRTDTDVRRILMLINFAASTVKGILRDGVLDGGWAAINGYEWTDWLTRNGAWKSTTDGAVVHAIYDYTFAFSKGNTAVRNLEAGTATYGVLRLFLTYKGAIFWEMQAGMGDVVFAPLYRVLKERGVKFEFFRNIENLGVSNGVVDTIDLSVQATVKDGAEYEPLIRVGGTYSWPAKPFYDQLVQGEELREKGIDLESFWADWPGTPQTLQRGQDFDDVVLGISIGSFPYIAKEVLAASQPMKLMVQNIGTVQTASVQLWFDTNNVGLGASDVGRASTAGVEPLSTWSDMSFLLQREQWPPEASAPPPQFIAYMIGVLEDAANYPTPPDPAFPIAQLARWRKIAIDWLQENTGTIWPKGVGADGKSLNWNLLHDSSGRSGEQRLDAQYLKVNIDPSERYVSSFTSTSIYRLNPGASGLPNLYLSGDWVKTEINAGCVEAAVMAGLACASALSGEPVKIIQ